MAGTLADMKSRIADEIARADLTSQIALAINTAIASYQLKRFATSERRDIYFNTPSVVISGAANNGQGLVRLTVTSTTQFTTGQLVSPTGVTGTTEANGTWVCTVIDSTHVDLVGTTFVNAYTGGGILGQEFYTTALNNAGATFDLTTIRRLDYVKLIYNSYPYTLPDMLPEEIERLSREGTNTGQPLYRTWYGNMLRLWPVPVQTYKVRLGCVAAITPPQTDVETNNFWMVGGESSRPGGELLIRSRAKAEIYQHVTRNYQEAAACYQQAQAELLKLEFEAYRMQQQGGWRVSYPEF